MLQRTIIFLTAFYLSFTSIAAANEGPVTAELLVEQQSIKPKKPFTVAIRLQLEDSWHAYWKNPGDSGMAPVVEWKLPNGFKPGPIQWPTPIKFTQNSLVGFGYKKELTLLTEITPPARLPESAKIEANVRWVVCNEESCLPGKKTLEITVPTSRAAPKNEEAHLEHFKNARSRLPKPHYQAIAERKDQLIYLKIKSAAPIVQAHFYPENSEQIEHSLDPILTRSKEDPELYRLIVKEAEGADKLEPIRGIIVLHTEGAEGTSSQSFEVNLPITTSSADDIAFNDELISYAYSTGKHDFEGGFALALLLAFAGGLLLNLMPCVLPVLSFKVLSFVKMAGRDKTSVLKHGIAFSGGVLLSFWTLAGVLLVLQAYGRSVGWGFQLQEPIFVGILAAIIFVFALSLFGVFEIGTGFASAAGQAQSSKQSGLTASFFSGILATAVATPCTGPFLGTAVGFAVTLPPALSMLIFTALGLGMASPYLLLGAFPSLLRYLPKPGNWMIIFKEIMGFIMLATVLWLLWIFGAQTSPFALTLLLAGFFFMTIGCWILGKWGTPIQSKVTRRISYLFTFAFLSLGSYTLYFASSNESLVHTEEQHISDSGWEPYSSLRVAELRQQGIPLFIDFTAKWCLICQTNHMVLTTKDVEKKFDALGIIRMKADWTKNDSEIAAELKKFGRNSVPLYLLYNRDASTPPTVLPQVLTPEIVIAELKKIERKS